MKTISQSNAKKRLFKIVDAKRLNKRSREFKLVADAIDQRCRRIDTVWTTGSSWKYSSLINETASVSRILTEIGIEFKTENDAPRGGKTGEHLVLVTKIKATKDFEKIKA